MALVTLPVHHPARPPDISQQEAGEGGRARWWAERGRGHCAGLNACKNEMQDAQHKQTTQGGEGGGGRGRGETNQAKPQADRTRNRTKKTQNQKRNHQQNGEHKQAIWPTGETKIQQVNTGKNRGGGNHAVYRRATQKRNLSKVIVRNSVVPKNTKQGNKRTRKNSQQQQSSKSVEQQKQQVESQPALPPLRERELD